MLRDFKKTAFGLALVSSLLCGCNSGGGDGGGADFEESTYAGSWSGTWDNTTFGSTGTGSAVITFIDGGAGLDTFTLTLDLNGGIFGGADPAPEVFTGTNNDVQATLDPSVSAVYGTLTGTLAADGTLTIDGTAIPGGVDTFAFTGTWTSTKVTGNVVITFDGGGTPANATMTFTRT